LLIYIEKFTVNFFSKMTASLVPCGFQPLLKNLSIKLSTESVGNRAQVTVYQGFEPLRVVRRHPLKDVAGAGALTAVFPARPGSSQSGRKVDA